MNKHKLDTKTYSYIHGICSIKFIFSKKREVNYLLGVCKGFLVFLFLQKYAETDVWFCQIPNIYHTYGYRFLGSGDLPHG